MFNQSKVIWYGLGGAFDGYHPVESKFWIYVSGVLFNAGLLVMNSFISFSFDRDTVWRDSVGMGETGAFRPAPSKGPPSRVGRVDLDQPERAFRVHAP